MLNCEQTSKLVSQGLDGKLPWRKRLAVRLHLFMCSACWSYRRQIEGLEKLIRKACGKRPESGSDGTLHLSDAAKQRILEQMKHGS